MTFDPICQIVNDFIWFHICIINFEAILTYVNQFGSAEAKDLGITKAAGSRFQMDKTKSNKDNI